ncbi:MAG: hypothetical protein KAJ78_10195 [Acidobacteria bacterium]|nr:hypothetical protein [Acidobacteriota bacterium]
MATPFVQGRLRKSDLSVDIETECAHCGTAIHLEVDSELKSRVMTSGCVPLVFEPDVDWNTYTLPTIIDGY